jgi:hypothetical protein
MKPRAFVEEYAVRDGRRFMVAVYERNPPSVIYRENIDVRRDASDAEILTAIAAVWNKMASNALTAEP